MGDNVTELEQRADDLRKVVNAPTPAEELAAVERQIAAGKETTAREAAEGWLTDHVLAVKKLYGSLLEMLERVRANPNARDVETANRIWDNIVRRVELAEVIQKRCPSVAVPTVPTVVPPGRHGLDKVAGLSIATPRRQLFPVVTASDSPELRERIFARTAWEYLRGLGTGLPEELRPAVAAEVPEPDLSERGARDRADTARQRAVAERASRVW